MGILENNCLITGDMATGKTRSVKEVMNRKTSNVMIVTEIPDEYDNLAYSHEVMNIHGSQDITDDSITRGDKPKMLVYKIDMSITNDDELYKEKFDLTQKINSLLLLANKEHFTIIFDDYIDNDILNITKTCQGYNVNVVVVTQNEAHLNDEILANFSEKFMFDQIG